MYAEMPASGLTEFILFLCTSAVWGPSCFRAYLKEQQVAASCIHSPSSSAITVGEGQHPLDCSFGSPHSCLEASDRGWL